MAQLDPDIQEEVLARLEVNDLLRSKSVCKSWRSLISSSGFVKCHLDYNLKRLKDTHEIGDKRIALTETLRTIRDDEGRSSIEYDGFKVDVDVDGGMLSYECLLVGASNGLVCLSRHFTDFFVLNPATREMKKLISPHEERFDMVDYLKSNCISGFGYDSFINDYKVIIGFITPHNRYLFKVLNLKSNVWRPVAAPGEFLYSSPMRNDGMLCNGAIHWLLLDRKGKQVILSFDLSGESFKEITPPPNLDDRYVTLGTMNEYLCIFDHMETIWLKRDYNIQEWEQVLPPPLYDANSTLTDYIPHDKYGHVRIWWIEEGSSSPLLVQSIASPDERGHIRLSTNRECNYNYNCHGFVKSLVSPHGLNDGDGGGDHIN